MLFNELSPEQQQKLLGKLARLKALAECPTGNVNETATAAAAMTRLMLEYQVELAALGVEEEHGGVEELPVTAPRASGLPMWQLRLINGLAEAHHCRCYSHSRVVGFYVESFRRATEKQHFLVGARQDVQQVKRLYEFCLEEIERLCWIWNPRARVSAKNDFRLGASNGIVSKVASELQSVMAEQHSSALILFESKLQAVEDRFRQLGVQIVSRTYRSPAASAYNAGYQAGCQVEVSGRSRPALPSGRRQGE